MKLAHHSEQWSQRKTGVADEGARELCLAAYPRGAVARHLLGVSDSVDEEV